MPRPRKRRRLPAKLDPRAAVMVLHRRLSEAEKRLDRLEGRRKRIGFVAVDAVGEVREQDPDSDYEDIPEEVP